MPNELAGKLLERNRVGALLRVFASSPEVVEHQVESAITALRRLLVLRTNGKPTFARIDFLVSNDQRYADSDCDLTTTRLRALVDAEFSNFPVNVLNIKYGDIFCMLLNYGIVNQLEDRIPYSCIISHHASAYITQENIDALLGAMQQKARVAGLAFGEIKELVERGRVANTFSIWHNKSLMTIGGFDMRSAKPMKESTHPTITSKNAISPAYKKEEATYHVAGCEEIIPLVHLTRNFGPCIKIITATETNLTWGAHPLKDPEGYERHLAKIITKDARQQHMAGLVGADIAYLTEGMITSGESFPTV